MVLHTAAAAAAASDRGHAAQWRHATPSMTLFSGGCIVPRAHVIAEGSSSLCLSLVMQ